MNSIKLLSTLLEFQLLFPTANIVDFFNQEKNKNCSKLIIENNQSLIDVEHYNEINFYEKINNLNNKSILDIDSLYINPIDNLVIVCDRKLWNEFYLPLLITDKEKFYIIENNYVKCNVTVLFNFAILEANDYEKLQEYFLYDFKFKNIKLTDYELFKNEKNFFYDSFYSLYNILSDYQLIKYLNNNFEYGNNEYLFNFKDMFDAGKITNRIIRPKVYNHTFLKPRYHRVKFLLEANKKNLLENGRVNCNIKFINEYFEKINKGEIYTDNTKNFTENHKKFFNKDLYNEFIKIKNKINLTEDDPQILYNHYENYFCRKEYNEAYIEIAGETHCIFDLKYGFFSEKSLKPILSNNFFMIYGSNKVYNEFNRIGIELFLNELELNGIENVDVLKQIDIIINSLEKLDKEKVSKLYIKNYNKIQNNRKILINYYCHIMNKINVLLLK